MTLWVIIIIKKISVFIWTLQNENHNEIVISFDRTGLKQFPTTTKNLCWTLKTFKCNIYCLLLAPISSTEIESLLRLNGLITVSTGCCDIMTKQKTSLPFKVNFFISICNIELHWYSLANVVTCRARYMPWHITPLWLVANNMQPGITGGKWENLGGLHVWRTGENGSQPFSWCQSKLFVSPKS